MNVADFELLRQQCNNFQTEPDREALENDLVFIGLFALQDDLREKVAHAVNYAKHGHINVRMISGDHIETAKQTAIKAGIITEAESREKYVVMSGEEFRSIVGNMRKDRDSENKEKYTI
jgi:P-type E1-E2 ATPase